MMICDEHCFGVHIRRTVARESVRAAAHICLVLGGAIVATVLALSALGDGVARRVNPRAGR